MFSSLLSVGLLLNGLAGAVPASIDNAVPTVDLGYAVYSGYYDSQSQLNYFKGMRYAAAPVGDLRWARPQQPPTNRTPVALNENWPPQCPQSPQAPEPPGYNFLTSGNMGSEDCLFLSVIAPPGAKDLPVLFYIHGGGYGGGAGNYDFTEMMNTNDNGFVFVGIQYRLGAFGFLSSSEVATYGTANAGLWDQELALEWVQEHISKFGGDPSRVTISGESAGAGSVMTHAMAHGGTLGKKLFQNAIVASPYLPQQWDYDGIAPEQFYYYFAQASGCFNESDSNNRTVFQCLRDADTITLQNASALVSMGGRYGTWAFLPVTDGDFLQERPSVQLLKGKVNGVRMLSGNNADEGAPFVTPHISTEADFDNFINTSFPLMDSAAQANLAQTYAIDPVIEGSPLYSTQGDQGPTALNQSVFAIGQQQRANNVYAETTFVCPAYWLATAFNRQRGGSAWKYQFSVPPSQHAADLDAYYSATFINPGSGTMSPGFREGMQKIWGRFVMYNNPTLSKDVVRQLAANDSKHGFDASLPHNWKSWKGTEGNSVMLNLNMTGGVPTTTTITWSDGTQQDVVEYQEPGLLADWKVVDAYDWEGGRGGRCQYWADIGNVVPE